MAQPSTQRIDGIDVAVNYVNEGDAPVTDEEIRAYIERGNLQHPGSVVTGLSLEVDGKDVGISYKLSPVPFERIRRITGYLVGTWTVGTTRSRPRSMTASSTALLARRARSPARTAASARAPTALGAERPCESRQEKPCSLPGRGCKVAACFVY